MAEKQQNKQRNRQEQESPKDTANRGFFWPLLILILAWLLIWSQFQKSGTQISYSQFKHELKSGNVERLEARGETLTGTLKEPIVISPNAKQQAQNGQSDRQKKTKQTQSGEPAQKTDKGVQSIQEKQQEEQQEKREIKNFTTTIPPFGDENLTQEIMKHDIEFISHGSDEGGFWFILINILPFLLLIGLGIFIVSSMSQRAGGMMSIGRSQAKKFEKEKATVTFKDVAGLKEAKEGLKEIITYLKNPDRFSRMGCRVPKGILLVGPPGTGKTLLARSVAGEAEAPFFHITGSDFMEMFVGVGASRVRDLFNTAKQNAPCIIFVDELDSIGRQRGAGLGGGHDEREQTLNQLLSEIDGFEPTDNVVVIAATNRPDILDPALLRPGRFDRKVVTDLPSLPERVEILNVHAKRIPLAEDVDLKEIARTMPGRSGADLDNLVNEAALLAARQQKKQVGKEEFSQARDQILMGQTRGGIILQEDEKWSISLHESGHALVAHLTEEADVVEKISIIPRGRALGATQQLPEERYNYTKPYLEGRIKVMLGGRASEETVLGTVSTGAADDLNQATHLARRMIGQWGMSNKYKNISFINGGKNVFLGEQIAKQREYSEYIAQEIDMEMKELIDSCYETAKNLLETHKDRLITIAKAVEEEEVIEGDRLRELLDGNEPSSQ